MLAHVYNVTIGRSVGAPGHRREVIDGLNATEKSFLFMLMTTVQLPCVSGYGKHTTMHT